MGETSLHHPRARSLARRDPVGNHWVGRLVLALEVGVALALTIGAALGLWVGP